jgi:sirohydrochlorin ferrochelatase
VKRAVLLVDHGSRRGEANAQLDALAERVRSRLPDHFVQVAHMELAAPSVAQGIDACVAAGAEEIVVHPYFLGPGRHTRHDIPRLVAEAAARHAGLRIAVSEPLGLHDKLVDVVVARVDEAGGGGGA